jgi:hypothetical protein
MRLVMAGELAFNRGTLIEVLDEGSWDQYEVHPTWVDMVSFKLSRPFLKFQATLNGTAANYARLCDRLEVPLNQYREAETALLAAHADSSWFAVYNPAGNVVQQLSVPDTYLKYAYRTASAEGMRRAALLVSQLRSRAVPSDRIPAEVNQAALRDPYTGRAFEWDAQRQSVAFNGPEEHQWRRHEFFF